MRRGSVSLVGYGGEGRWDEVTRVGRVCCAVLGRGGRGGSANTEVDGGAHCGDDLERLEVVHVDLLARIKFVLM